MSMNEKSGAELAAEEINRYVYHRLGLSVDSRDIDAIITKHLPSGDVGKLREALIECRDHLEAERRRIGSSVMDNERIERVRAALASVPASPPKQQSNQPEGYCEICMLQKPCCCCFGIQPYSLSNYPGERGLSETHPANEGEQWYKRTDVDPMLDALIGRDRQWRDKYIQAMETWAEQNAAANPPQVDTTLEEIAVGLQSFASSQKYIGAFADADAIQQFAEAISAHARKSQPKEGVNQKMLKALEMVQQSYNENEQLSDEDLVMEMVQDAIRAAESAAVPSMEAKIEVLKYAASLCESKNLSFKNEGYRAACEDIKTCLLASIERLEAGEQMEATASTDSASPSASSSGEQSPS